ALLGADAGKGARRVDQAKDRHAELRCQTHVLQRLAIPFGMRTTVQAIVALGKRVSLLMTDQHDAKIAQAGKAGADGSIVAKGTVAMQLDELLEDQIDVIEGLRP